MTHFRPLGQKSGKNPLFLEYLFEDTTVSIWSFLTFNAPIGSKNRRYSILIRIASCETIPIFHDGARPIHDRHCLNPLHKLTIVWILIHCLDNKWCLHFIRNYQHTFSLFLTCQMSKETPFLVQLKNFFGASYFFCN